MNPIEVRLALFAASDMVGEPTGGSDCSLGQATSDSFHGIVQRRNCDTVLCVVPVVLLESLEDSWERVRRRDLRARWRSTFTWLRVSIMAIAISDRSSSS